MYNTLKLIHLAAAMVWLGGMTVLLWAVRPAVLQLVLPPQRQQLLGRVLQRFFAAVWVCIALLLATGLHMYGSVAAKLGKAHGGLPLGWHVMAAVGLAMTAIFGHLYFAHYRKLQTALSAQDWPVATTQLGKMHPLILLNCALGWVAVLAVRLA